MPASNCHRPAAEPGTLAVTPKMPRHRSNLDRAVGQLILAIQKEEGEVAGDPDLWPPAQEARARAESLLSLANDPARFRAALRGSMLTTYIGAKWLAAHRRVRPALLEVSKVLNESDG